MKYINKCTICKHDEFRNIGTPRIDKNFPRKNTSDYLILQCKKCGYYFISPEIDLTIEEWQILYENEYFLGEDITRWQKRLRESERKKRLGIIINRLKCNNGNFLDMGCGEGYLLKDAEKIGFSTYGVDIANNILNENSGCNFFKGSIFEANFPDNFFKVIYMDSVLEHIINPMETLSELKRILEPGGVIFLIVPNEDSLVNSFIKWIYILLGQKSKYGKIKPFVSPYHIQGFNNKSLTTALNNCGFRNIEINGFGGNYTFWKAYKFASKNYFQSLITYPIGLISILTNQQIQLMAIASK